MIVLASSFILGTLLAQRFRVLILVPASLLTALSAAAGHEALSGYSGSIWLTAVTAAAILQAGYLAGLVVRVGLASFRPRSRDRSAAGQLPHPLAD